jgi:hypothetical protein
MCLETKLSLGVDILSPLTFDLRPYRPFSPLSVSLPAGHDSTPSPGIFWVMQNHGNESESVRNLTTQIVQYC